MLHPENRHIVIGVPRINVTLPECNGSTMASDFILGAGAARDCHNAADSRSKACVYGFSSAALWKMAAPTTPLLGALCARGAEPGARAQPRLPTVVLRRGRCRTARRLLRGAVRANPIARREAASARAGLGGERQAALLGWRALRNQALAHARSQQAFLAASASRGSYLKRTVARATPSVKRSCASPVARQWRCSAFD